MVKTYATKPVLIKAVQWTGKNIDEVKYFVRDYLRLKTGDGESKIYIVTFGGYLQVTVGDYIIKEESYQESFNRPPTKNIRITYLTDTEEIKKFMEQRNK